MHVSLLVRLWVEMRLLWRVGEPEQVSLLVRLWVEIACYQQVYMLWFVSLLVRLWVEISSRMLFVVSCPSQPPCEAVSWNGYDDNVYYAGRPSASLWGCELKYDSYARFDRDGSQPPCEAVSWNLDWVLALLPHSRQPPCEAVSWNIASHTSSVLRNVSLLVRLWVEIEVKQEQQIQLEVSLLVRLWVEIAKFTKNNSVKKSQPPCEAVSWNMFLYTIFNSCTGQPPCEAVSWNKDYDDFYDRCKGSASLWGCELKCKLPANMSLTEPVSLLVRLWVEITKGTAQGMHLSSASLWGCELKYWGRYKV